LNNYSEEEKANREVFAFKDDRACLYTASHLEKKGVQKLLLSVSLNEIKCNEVKSQHFNK